MVSRKAFGVVSKYPRLAAIGFLFGVFVAGFAILYFVTNFTIVYDPHEVVKNARLVWTGGYKDMLKVPLVGYVVHVDGDAGIEIICKNGQVVNGGYVTGFAADDYSVTAACEIESE